MDDRCIGKLVKSNTHTDYVCQIYNPGEVDTLPSPSDFVFGTFVRIPLDAEQGHLVGVIYDTILLNPDFGNLGPRLSPAPDLAVFSPDYLAEKVTLVGITAVGTLSVEGVPTHGVPSLAAKIDTRSSAWMRLRSARFIRHRRAESNWATSRCSWAWRVRWPGTCCSTSSSTCRRCSRSIGLSLTVLREELAWQTTITPLGGGSR